MTVQERSDNFKRWIHESDIFDVDIWWDPKFDKGFVCYDDWNKQMEDYMAMGITGGIVTTRDSVVYDAYVGNDITAELVKDRDGFYGCMVVVPEMGYCEDKGEAYVKGMMEKKIVAARLFPKTYIHSMQEYAIGPILDTLEKLGVPLMLWHTEATWDDMGRICENHPNLNVIVEGHDRKLLYHARDYFGLMRKYKNFFVETHNIILFDEFEAIDKYCGCDQLLYGSYFPYMTPNFSLYSIQDAQISEENRQKIISGNAKRIFNIK
ncbi:MAG: amidohydrolase family protein [Oscillospiraceae bacterium]|nr:amidohydrolase family protein [Oscillospiraceae bacterium]MBQ3049402.1 amidohydrolase family protein [Oscillospiraceae bacterium]MBQ9939561.1 amidohydrolase family protein [Oscillospiraceae bacterium]